MARHMSRKELLQLGTVLFIGWGAAQVFQKSAPIGRDVSTNRNAQTMLYDHVSPRLEVKGADLTMVVFSDYQCPACKVAAPAMDAAVKRDGRVRVIYRDWPIFGPRSDRAARVAVAAARQGIYLDLHRRLMGERRQIDDAILKADVEAAGGKWQQIVDDIANDGTAIDQQIAGNGAAAFALNLPGTPAYLIGTILVVGGLKEAEFIDAFDDARRQRP